MAESLVNKRCETCRFLAENKGLSIGGTWYVCRRFPPQQSEGGSGWPRVRPDKDWCGEWADRDRK